MNDDFIGIYENFIPYTECENFIKIFETMKEMNLTLQRNEILEGAGDLKSDETFFMTDYIVSHPQNSIFANLTNKIWKNYKEYVKKYYTLSHHKPFIKEIRIQKTMPGQGYHLWHQENEGVDVNNRFLAWMIYLNDIEEGGKTEFLYLHKRIRPKAGTLLMWPAGFTHAHRGNQPLTGNKYIITSWFENMN